MAKKRKRVILIGAAVLIVIMSFIIYFIKRPTKIERTMSGVIIDKQTKKQIGTTSVTMDLKRYWKRDGYDFKGKMQFEDLDYTKEEEDNLDIMYSDDSEYNMIFGNLMYQVNTLSGGDYRPDTKVLLGRVVDKDWSGFVIYDFDEDYVHNKNEIMVFPAETEQEALEVINKYNQNDNIFEMNYTEPEDESENEEEPALMR